MPHANSSFSLNERLPGFLLWTSCDVIVSLVTSCIFIFPFFFCSKQEIFIAPCVVSIALKGVQRTVLSTVARSDASVPQSFFMEMNHSPQYLCAIVAEQWDIVAAVCLVVSMLPTSDFASILNKFKLSCGLSNMTICSSRTSGGMIANCCPAVGRTIVHLLCTVSFQGWPTVRVYVLHSDCCCRSEQ